MNARCSLDGGGWDRTLTNVRNPPWFAFVCHPRDDRDLLSYGASTLVRAYSVSQSEFRDRVCTAPPQVTGALRFGGAAIHGEVIGAIRMPEQISAPAGYRDVLDAIDLGIARGAGVIGLGGLTAPATQGGALVLPRLPGNVTVTNGNALTAAIARRNVGEVVQLLDLDRAARVAVIGATGSLGMPASMLLAEDGYELLLVGRGLRRTRSLLGELAGSARLSGSIKDVADCDVVVIVTSSETARVAPEWLRPGTVVIDVAQPHSIPPEDIAVFAEHGVAVVEGGLVTFPAFSSDHDFFLPEPRAAFACLAETYLFAREGIRAHSIGRPSADLALKLEKLAMVHGIVPRAVDNLDAAVTVRRSQATMEMPLTCNLSPSGQLDRGLALRALSLRAGRGSQRVPEGVLLRFAPSEAMHDELETFARDEKECCSFLSFGIAEDGSDLTLLISGPPAAGTVIEGLRYAFDSAQDGVSAQAG